VRWCSCQFVPLSTMTAAPAFFLLATSLHNLVGARAPNEVVARGTSVSHGTSVLAIRVEHNTVSTRRATAVGAAAKDRELLVRSTDSEVEALVVVKVVRVVVAADLLVVGVVVVTLVDGSVDLAGRVVGAAAGGGGLACNESAGLNGLDLSDWDWGGDGGDCEEQGAADEGETHVGSEKSGRFGG